MMAGIRGKDTQPELAVRRFLHARGYRFRLHVKELPGRPDLVLRRWNAVVLVQGCFWHRHVGCRYFKLPTSRQEFWSGKLSSNAERDARNLYALRERGWRVGIVWECALRDDPQVALSNIAAWLVTDRPLLELKSPRSQDLAQSTPVANRAPGSNLRVGS
jgi:DNA mismatch endonuclease (patch repair protein)